MKMKKGDKVTLNRTIRSATTGTILPMEGTVVREIENLGRILILVDFGSEQDYIFPNEVVLKEAA